MNANAQYHWTMVVHWCDPITNEKFSYVSAPHGNRTPREYRYMQGRETPNYPMPAIPLKVVWPDAMNYMGYKDMIYIDDVSEPDDPVMVCAWDFYLGANRIGKYGEYTRT